MALLVYLLSQAAIRPMLMKKKIQVETNQLATSWNILRRDLNQDWRRIKRRLESLSQIGIRFETRKNYLLIDISDYLNRGHTTTTLDDQPWSHDHASDQDRGHTTTLTMVTRPHSEEKPWAHDHSDRGRTTTVDDSNVSRINAAEPLKQDREEEYENKKGEENARATPPLDISDFELRVRSKILAQNPSGYEGDHMLFTAGWLSRQDWQEFHLENPDLLDQILNQDISPEVKKAPPLHENDIVAHWEGLHRKSRSESKLSTSDFANIVRRTITQIECDSEYIQRLLEFVNSLPNPYLSKIFMFNPQNIFVPDRETGQTPLEEADHLFNRRKKYATR